MAGFSALGTIVRMSTASAIAANATSAGIADLTNISGPSMSAEEIDVSSHDSTSNFREFVSGFLDGGEVSLEGNLTLAGGADTLVTAFNDREERYIQIAFPATGTSTADANVRLRWQFKGTVTGVETAAPYDDKASFGASVRISGAPHLVATSSSGIWA
jgi:predicted secreted protein